MSVIYEAPESHECINRPGWQPRMTPGSIFQCGCGRYFKRGRTYNAEGTSMWYPVHWWNFKARCKIRQSSCGAM